jgi:uncharacterized protein YjbJ (UPF0337 family)
MGGKTDIVIGRIKEAVGALTDNNKLRDRGQADQAVGKVKYATQAAVGKVKLAARKSIRAAKAIARKAVNEAKVVAKKSMNKSKDAATSP